MAQPGTGALALVPNAYRGRSEKFKIMIATMEEHIATVLD
jgi:hypothetical protein